MQTLKIYLYGGGWSAREVGDTLLLGKHDRVVFEEAKLCLQSPHSSIKSRVAKVRRWIKKYATKFPAVKFEFAD